MSALGQKRIFADFFLEIFLRQNWEKERGVGTTLHLVAISERLLCAKNSY